ncbi:hypothetical protein Tco_1352749 [Tanacetum coccineum]
MATTNKESSAAGTDNRPPMLEESDFESWKIRIERYIRGKPLGKLIWKSIKNGPSPHPMITVTTGEGEQQTQVTKEKTDEEFTEAENNKERADIQATNILRSGLTEQQKKETLFDQYERFQANGNESIHDYFVPFHKLINDMKMTKMEIPYAPAPQQAPQSTNDAMLATMNQIITTESDQRRAPGHVARECKEKKRAKDLQWFKDKALLMEAKEKGAILDAQAEAFLTDVECTAPYSEPLAITATTAFEVSHEDAYDSDVDEAPHAAAAFMANLMQTDDLRSQLEGHIKTNEEQSFANDSLKAELERYKTQVQDLEPNKVKKDLEQLVFERNKQNADLEEQFVSLKQQLLQHVESNKSLKTESEKLKADKNALEESYLEELVWLRNTNKFGKNLLIQNECLLAESVSKDICSIVLTSGIAVPMSVEPRSNYVKEHSKNLELEAETLKVKQLLVEKEKRCSFIETKYQELELKFQKYKECFENPQVCNNSSSPELNVFFEINKLKDQLQGKDELIRKLKAQFLASLNL